MRIHNNELDKCQYCPYQYVQGHHYKDHLNKHFGIKDHKCDYCGLSFTTKRGLVEHSSKQRSAGTFPIGLSDEENMLKIHRNVRTVKINH